MLCDIGYSSETDLKLKTREISFFHNICFSCPNQTFWKFPQSTALIPPCSVQNFETIRLFQWMLGMDEISWNLSPGCVSDISSIAEHPPSPLHQQAISRDDASLVFWGNKTNAASILGYDIKKVSLTCQLYSGAKFVRYMRKHNMMFAVFIMPQHWDGRGVRFPHVRKGPVHPSQTKPWPGNIRSQGIGSHVIDLVIPEY